MLFFPVKRYEIFSLAKPSEIATALGAHVQSLPIVTRLGGHKTFAGSVSETGFRFIRVGEHRNSFRPTVSGIFSSDSQLTTIRVTIKHDAYFFIPLMIISLLFVLFSLKSQEIINNLSQPYIFLLQIPAAIFFMGYFYAVISFSREASAAQKELEGILDPFIIKTENSTN